jgi:hypothetical protein
VADACRDRKLGKESSAAPAQPQSSQGGSTLIAREGGRTEYDARLAVTWLADANLAAKETFGVPNINKSGSMNYANCKQRENMRSEVHPITSPSIRVESMANAKSRHGNRRLR